LISFTSYPFQRRVADLLLSGQNVILQAPTGAGKTYAALLPLIEARERGLAFPPRCIYSVPMRVLANQFAASEQGQAHGAKIQTGEHGDDPTFLNDLTFATIDQTLSSFLMTPYSLGRRRGNLNAGAIASSYLVFDEFHLFDPQTMLPTTLEMLRILRGITPFLLMTATFSRDMLAGLADYLHAVVVPETPGDVEALQTLPSQDKTRRYHVAERPLDADAVLERHRGRSLVICNTVERAQRLCLALRERSSDDEVILLHARFLATDRAPIEDRLRALFGKDAGPDVRCIAVATQAIEVGLDITCNALHTELAPANAILQRAGRCARYKGEQGDVFVYPLARDAQGEPLDLAENTAPYMDLKPEIAATLSEIAGRSGRTFTFTDEQALISAVHGPRDHRTVEGLKAIGGSHRNMMNLCWNGETRGAAAELIRSVASQKIIIHDDPMAVAARPFAYEGFSLHVGSVAGLVKRWLERLNESASEDAGVWGVCELPSEDGEEQVWDAIEIYDAKDVGGYVALIVSPSLARYDADLGFWPHEGGDFVNPAAPPKEHSYKAYSYHLEPYAEHARLVWQAHRAEWERMAHAARLLERRAEWPEGSISRVAEALALVHDLGKLDVGWQTWVRKYQRMIGRPVSEGLYAHTDSDAQNPQHREAARAAGKRPAHAVESAVAAVRLLERIAVEPSLTKAAFSAIARHHSAFSSNLGSFRLAKGSYDLVGAVLAEAGVPVPEGRDWLWTKGEAIELQKEVEGLIVNPDRDDDFVAYMLLARALRLADQEGTGAASKPHPA
jgi:CRISPR-associated endonuclease/helicase Cas3